MNYRVRMLYRYQMLKANNNQQNQEDITIPQLLEKRLDQTFQKPKQMTLVNFVL